MEINYRVHVTPDRAFVKISNKASYLTCEPLRKFFEEQTKAGQKRYIIDFKDCASMDSTFLGILVSVALQIRSNQNGGSMVLLNLTGRNLETVSNLGIHQITEVSSEEIRDVQQLEELVQNSAQSSVGTNTVYQAHKALMNLNDKNLKVFSDVVSYLEQKKEE
ncbi:MAG: STAS domain-containing protein [Opitutae bacterium]